MAKAEVMVAEGVVKESLANAKFKIILDNGYEVLGHICGKMRKNFIKVIPGDRVEVEISPYDLTKGRVSRRLK